MPSRHPSTKADVVSSATTTSPTNTTTASPMKTTTSTTAPTSSTTRRRGSWQGTLQTERPQRTAPTPTLKESCETGKESCEMGKEQRPRPRGGRFGLGAASALLRAAGALPRTGRCERKAKEPDPPPEALPETSSPEDEQVARTVARLESSEVVAKAASVEPPVTAEPPTIAEDAANIDPYDGVCLACHKSSDPVEASLLPEPTHADVNSALCEKVSSDASDFLEYCLGGTAALLDMEVDLAANEDDVEESFFSVADENDVEESLDRDESFNLGSNSCQEFSMGLNPSSGEISESDDDAEGQDLEDMFDFDPERLAELMNSGASMDELTDHLQESYACAFERRLSMDNKREAIVEADSTADDARPQLQMGDLTPLMTPEHVSPLVTPKGVAGSLAINEHAEQALEEEAQRRSGRARRSLAMQHRPSTTQRGGIAVKAMEAFGRRSLARVSGATAEEREQLEDAVVDAMRRASRRHRRSVAKAAEVLEEVAEASNVPLDAWSENQIDDKVEVVQKAMEEAYRQHRRGITAAVHDVVTGTVEHLTEVDAPKDSTVETRIREAVAAAHKRHRGLVEQSQRTGQRHEQEQSQWPEQWQEEQQSQWPEQWNEEQQIPWAEQWHGEEQSQWAEQLHEEASAHTDAWSAEYEAFGAEWSSNTCADTYCDTPNIAWNVVPSGYESTSKLAEWNAHAPRLQAPWRYGSA